MKNRISSFISSPTTVFAFAFATVAVGFFMRFEPRIYQWLLTLLFVEPDTAVFIVRIMASILMVGGSVFLFFAANRLRHSKQKGLLRQIVERGKSS